MTDETWAEVADRHSGIEDIDALWSLAEDFSITDATALVAGYNPIAVERYIGASSFDEAFPRYEVAFRAITRAIVNERVKAAIRYSAREYGYADQLTDIDHAEIEGWPALGTTAGEDEVLSKDHSCFFRPFADWKLSAYSGRW